MKVVILGAAAGGGSPQWNCRCPVCALAWAGDRRVGRRTQVGFGATRDGRSWALFNCSPDIREQISNYPELQPRDGIRTSPVRDVVLTNGDVDHIGGLLSLREGHGFAIHATPVIHRILDSNPIFGVLDAAKVRRVKVEPETPHILDSGIQITLFMVPGKPPLYLEDRGAIINERSDGTVGVEVAADGKRFYCIPACAAIDRPLAERFDRAELVFFDGTLWSDDEMIATGTGIKTGRRMGHIPVGGRDGSLAALRSLGIKRLVYIHINNTNPMLIEGSIENETVRAAGAEVGFDGQAIEL
jgi:pyrroloquinoline quinone biosynthesis protein B